MNPTHEQITERAQAIWRERACPEGRDEEIWLEAERQLRITAEPAPAATPSFVERVKAETAAESAVEYLISPAVSQQAAIEEAVELQRPPAKAPQMQFNKTPSPKR